MEAVILSLISKKNILKEIFLGCSGYTNALKLGRYIDKEDNAKLLEFMLNVLTSAEELQVS